MREGNSFGWQIAGRSEKRTGFPTAFGVGGQTLAACDFLQEPASNLQLAFTYQRSVEAITGAIKYTHYPLLADAAGMK